jgi:glycerate kinase
MHILIAPNAFKNSLDATKAAEAIEEGCKQSVLDCTTTRFPVADGGDGTGKLLAEYLSAIHIPVRVQDPLGRRMSSSFAWVERESTAIIELADVSGLRLLKPSEYDPLHATTFGTGELIREAVAKNARRIIICIGGSATVDGGTGMLQALGVELLDEEGKRLTGLPATLPSLSKIVIPNLFQRIMETEIIVLCDVENRLLGQEGSAAVFGPQKGASPNDVQLLEKGLSTLRDVALAITETDMALLKHGGAAGGIAATLHTFLKAKLVNGIDYFLEITRFDKELKKAHLVITGEGSLDAQTLKGKGPFGVVKKAKQFSVPVIGIAGKISEEKTLSQYFDKLITITPPGMEMSVALASTYQNLRIAARTLADQLASSI